MTLLDLPTSASLAPDLEVELLSPSFGARVHGLDLARADDDQVRAVRTALARYEVLCFARQDLDLDAQVALGRRLGDVTESHPVVPGVDEEHPEIYALDSAEGGLADSWHTDVTFVRSPPLGSVLRAVGVPPYGGDTQWADLELAYASLSAPVQRLADELVAVHDGTREFGYYLAQRKAAQTGVEGTTWGARPAAPSRRSSTPSCGSTRRPAARACSSTPGSRRTSSACPTPRAARCSTCPTPT